MATPSKAALTIFVVMQFAGLTNALKLPADRAPEEPDDVDALKRELSKLTAKVKAKEARGAVNNGTSDDMRAFVNSPAVVQDRKEKNAGQVVNLKTAEQGHNVGTAIAETTPLLTIPPANYSTDDCVSIGKPTNAPDLTIIAWVRTTAESGAIVARWTGTAISKNAWGLWMFNGKLRSWVSSTGANFPRVDGVALVNDGAWHMVGMTHDSVTSTTSLYVDGSVDATATTTGALYDQSPHDALVGAQNTPTVNCAYLLTGDIGNVVIYGAALSASDMASVAGGTLPQQSMAGSWFMSATTPAPTPAATPAPTPAPTTPAVGAHGDPHLVNKHGQKFDLFQPGHHTLIQIPRWVRRNTHFLVQAKATRAGAGCGDLYFTEINISGSWARKYKAANLRWVAEAPKPHSSAKWITFHNTISVKIVHGHTIENTKYLNILVKGLSKTTVPVGGLLGEDDHTAAATPSNGCRKVLTL